eukprot:509630_1
MKQAKNKDEFVSDTFEMASMNWCIQVYPNGNRDNNIGSFNVYLKLLSSPPQKGTKIIIFRRIYCKEYHSSYSAIISYKKDRSNGWPYYTLSLTEIKNSKLNTLTFIINIQILRIIKELYFGNKIMYQHNMQFNKKFN